MKQFLVYFGLFLFFVVVMSAVKSVDHYSLTYKNCAQKWQFDIRSAQNQPYKTEQLLEYLDQSTFNINGAHCPKLLPRHERYVRRELAKNL